MTLFEYFVGQALSAKSYKSTNRNDYIVEDAFDIAEKIMEKLKERIYYGEGLEDANEKLQSSDK